MKDKNNASEHNIPVRPPAGHPKCETCPLVRRTSCAVAPRPQKRGDQAEKDLKDSLRGNYPAWGFRLLSILVMALLLVSCDERTGAPLETTEPTAALVQDRGEPLRRGDRVLGIDLTMPETGDFDQAIALARGVGAEEVSLSVFWDDIELSPGVYAPDPNWLAIANAYYPHQNVRISLMVGPIDTNQLRVPLDLIGLPFDDPRLIARYIDLLDYVFTQIPQLTLSSLSVGNEVDILLGNDAALWQAYQTFYGAARDHIHAVRPGVPVGAKATFEGMMDARSGFIQELNRDSDVILATYYPLEPDFKVRPAATVHADLAALAAQYPETPIYLLEAGYPSSAVNGSSEAQQADFIREMFAAWDSQAAHIRLISFTWLTDLPEASVEDLESYYGIKDQAFSEFLRTLGLRTYSGEGADKPAWSALVAETAKRGWE